ncbi:MAG: serine protease, partial [Betaproteobacteria bacterium]|nr:serine protease [Betaproteobacteria bacterium]
MAAGRLIRTLVLGGGVLTAQPCAALTAEQVYKYVSRSVVMLYAAEPSGRIVGRGSGVFMRKDLLVTNCHVIARGKVFMVGHGKKRLPARLVGYDADKDLCALDVQGLNVAPARVGDAKTARVGQRVYAIGTPEGFELTLSEGLISGLR